MKHVNKTAFIFSIFFITNSQALQKKVLILGDSLSAVKGSGFGDQLDQMLRQQGYQSQVVAACGSSPSAFFGEEVASTKCGYLRREVDGTEDYLSYAQNKKSPKEIPNLNAVTQGTNANPDLVVIQQGTNLYGHLLNSPVSPNAIKKQVRDSLISFHKKFPNRKCIWAAPPKITRYDGKSVTVAHQRRMFELIQEAIQEYSLRDLGRAQGNPVCEILDGTQFTQNPDGSDGTHFFSKNPEWVNAAYKKVEDMFGNSLEENRAIQHGLSEN